MAVELATGYVSIVPSARNFGANLAREMTSAGRTAANSFERSFAANVGGMSRRGLSRMTTGLSSGLSAAGASTGRLFHSAFSTSFLNGVTATARRAASILGAGATAGSLFGIKTAADFEQTRIGFEGILGSAAAADKTLKELQKFAASTPFEFTGLATAAKQLLAVGFSSEEIIPTMTTLGNVAATLGVGEAEIQGVVRALGQMRGKGKASAEELQQISEQIPGFSAVKAISESLGIATSEAFKMMEEGALPADTAITAILEGMERFPGAAGAMERQSKTLNGVLSTFKDNLQIALIEGITPFLPAISSAVTKVTPLVKRFITFFIEAVTTATRVIGPLVSKGLELISGWWKDNGDGITQFFRDFTEDVKDFVSEALEGISNWWSENGDGIISFFRDLRDAIGEKLRSSARWIKDELLPWLYDFADWFIDNELAIVAALGSITGLFALWAITATAAALPTALLGLIALALGAAFGLLAYWFLEAYNKGGLFTDVVDVMAASFVFLMGGVSVFIELLRDIIEVFDDILEAAGRFGQGMADALGFLGPLNPFKGLGGDVSTTFGLKNTAGTRLRIRGSFDQGGIIPGPVGQPALIMAHSGETVLPTHRIAPAELGMTGGGVSQEFTIINPAPEPASDSIPKAMRRAALAIPG